MKKQLLCSLLGVLSSSLAYASTHTLESIIIQGNTTIPTDALELNLANNGIVKGQVLNTSGLNTFRQQVIDHYRYFRHSDAKVNTTLNYLPDHKVQLVLNIQENTAIYPHQQALPYDEEVYKDTVSTDASSTEDEQSLHEAQGDGILSLGVGYGNKGAIFRASLIKHQFLDTAGSMRLSARRDRYETNASLGYSYPDLFKRGTLLDTEIFYDTFNNKDSKTIAPYYRRSYGLSTTLRLPIDENSTVYTGLRFTRHHIKDIEPEYSRAHYLMSIDKQQWRFNSNDFDLLLGWEYKSLNKKFLPTKGMSFAIDGQVSLPGTDNLFYKINLEAQAYLPLNDQKTWVIHTKGSTGYADGINNHLVPFYQHYAVGGADTLRGFEYGAVGPKAVYGPAGMPSVSASASDYRRLGRQTVGGNAYAAASIALIVPSFFIPKEYRQAFQTSLFVDTANAWNTQSAYRHPLSSQHKEGHFRASAGLAIQWKFPFGVLSASYALPIKKYQGDRLQAFQLSISGSF